MDGVACSSGAAPLPSASLPPIASISTLYSEQTPTLTPSTAMTLLPKVEPKVEPPLGSPLNGLYPEFEDGIESGDDEDSDAFRLRDPLQEPVCKRFRTDALHMQIHESVIDLCPPYQRDVVWQESKQIALIDSIFHNYYVPPIVFAVQLDEEGEEIRICVDGKQRLTSIQKFMDGQIPHKDPVTKKSWWYTVPDNLMRQRQVLPDHIKKLFASKLITCMEYTNLTPGTERDIFQRVQMGITLTTAEKLQAISSPWADWITQLESRHVAVEGGLTEVLDWDISRGRDFQNIAYFVYCCDGFPGSEQIPTNQKLEKWLKRNDPPPHGFKDDIDHVLRGFWNIATDSELNTGLRNGKRLAPIEFIFIGVMLYVLRKRSVEEQAAGITHLRDAVRAEFRDIRTNGLVSKFLWGIVTKLEKREYGLPRPSENGKGKKRKKVDVDDEDEDYRPSSISRLSKAGKARSRR